MRAILLITQILNRRDRFKYIGKWDLRGTPISIIKHRNQKMSYSPLLTVELWRMWRKRWCLSKNSRRPTGCGWWAHWESDQESSVISPLRTRLYVWSHLTSPSSQKNVGLCSVCRVPLPPAEYARVLDLGLRNLLLQNKKICHGG